MSNEMIKERRSNLVLPDGFVSMDEEEMMYVDGGVSVAMSKYYLDKDNCLTAAAGYSISSMTTLDIAKELYAHAVLYYKSWIGVAGMVAAISVLVPGFALLGAVGGLALLLEIRSHANPCDLGGNSALYTAVFNAIWTLF